VRRRSLGQEPCAGVDVGDGFDCYGVPVHPNDPRTRRLTGVEKADVWQRLRAEGAQWYTFEEQAHIRAGTFGAEGLALWTAQTGGAQPLPQMTVTAERGLWWLALAGAALWFLSSRQQRT